MRADPDEKDLHYNLAFVAEKLGRLDQAARDFQRCRELPAGALPLLTTVRPLLGLCRVAAQRGELATAGDHVHQFRELIRANAHQDLLLIGVGGGYYYLQLRDGLVTGPGAVGVDSQADFITQDAARGAQDGNVRRLGRGGGHIPEHR